MTAYGLVRLAVGNDKSSQSKYDGPTGKPCAGKLARTVWSGGKTVRSYLSLFEVILCSAPAVAADAQSVSPLLSHRVLMSTRLGLSLWYTVLQADILIRVKLRGVLCPTQHEVLLLSRRIF